MEKPSAEEIRVATHKMLENMVASGWLSRVVATHDTANPRLTKEGASALRLFRALLATYQPNEFSEVDLVAFLNMATGDDLAFLDKR